MSRSELCLRGLSALLLMVALPAGAQSFRVQCPTSTITHPDPTGSGANNSEPTYKGPTAYTITPGGYVTPTGGTVNGAIKCQQISGGDGYSTMGDGTQTYMFSFGPLSGLENIRSGQPGTLFADDFNGGQIVQQIVITNGGTGYT